MPIDPRRVAMTAEGRMAERLADLERQQRRQQVGSFNRVVAMVRAIRTSDYVLADNVEDPVEWQDTDFDTVGMWDAATPTRLIAPLGGIYQVSANVTFPGPTAGVLNTAWGVRGCGFRHSVLGDIYGRNEQDAANGGGVATTADTKFTPIDVLPFEAGEYAEFEIFCRTPGAVALTLGAPGLSLTMTYLGTG